MPNVDIVKLSYSQFYYMLFWPSTIKIKKVNCKEIKRNFKNKQFKFPRAHQEAHLMGKSSQSHVIASSV
jgi:hypothetical protein